MANSQRFEQHYQAGFPPWDLGRPDRNLITIINSLPITIKRALEIGCGYGHNALWLAEKGIPVVACDVSPTAIQKARAKAAPKGLLARCHFVVADFLKDFIKQASFDLAFDRGCFHSFRNPEERRLFAQRVASCLRNKGLWLSLIGNADDELKGPPPKCTALEVVSAIEPFFKILLLKSGYFDSNKPKSPKAWICLAEKR